MTGPALPLDTPDNGAQHDASATSSRVKVIERPAGRSGTDRWVRWVEAEAAAALAEGYRALSYRCGDAVVTLELGAERGPG